MYFVYPLTIPAQTTQDDPVIAMMGLCYGTIMRVRVLFPPGPCGLAHMQIYRYEHQLYPTTPGASFAWDDTVIEFTDSYPLLGVPFEVKLLGWNTDDSYPHTIEVHLEVAEFDITRVLYELVQQGLGGAFGG